MTDETREVIALLTDMVDEVGIGFEGAFAAADRHRPLNDQLAVLHAGFSELRAEQRAQRFLIVMALVEGDQELLEASRHYDSAAVLVWRRLLALPAQYRDDVLEEWAQIVLDDEE